MVGGSQRLSLMNCLQKAPMTRALLKVSFIRAKGGVGGKRERERERYADSRRKFQSRQGVWWSWGLEALVRNWQGERGLGWRRRLRISWMRAWRECPIKLRNPKARSEHHCCIEQRVKGSDYRKSPLEVPLEAARPLQIGYKAALRLNISFSLSVCISPFSHC